MNFLDLKYKYINGMTILWHIRILDDYLDANQLLKVTETGILDKRKVQDFLMTMKTKNYLEKNIRIIMVL